MHSKTSVAKHIKLQTDITLKFSSLFYSSEHLQVLAYCCQSELTEAWLETYPAANPICRACLAVLLWQSHEAVLDVWQCNVEETCLRFC